MTRPSTTNYSLSNLFNNGPFYHLGVKAQYAFSDKAYLMVGLVNNIDRNFDNNRAKGFIRAVVPVAGQRLERLPEHGYFKRGEHPH